MDETVFKYVYYCRENWRYVILFEFICVREHILHIWYIVCTWNRIKLGLKQSFCVIHYNVNFFRHIFCCILYTVCTVLLCCTYIHNVRPGYKFTCIIWRYWLIHFSPFLHEKAGAFLLTGGSSLLGSSFFPYRKKGSLPSPNFGVQSSLIKISGPSLSQIFNVL